VEVAAGMQIQYFNTHSTPSKKQNVTRDAILTLEIMLWLVIFYAMVGAHGLNATMYLHIQIPIVVKDGCAMDQILHQHRLAATMKVMFVVLVALVLD
jgi:nitrate reductase NapE component